MSRKNFPGHRFRREVSACADFNASLMFRRVKRRPAFRRWTTSGQRPEEDFFY